MPYIIRDTSGTKNPDQTAFWSQFQARAQREGHSLSWVLWQLIRQYVENGLG